MDILKTRLEHAEAVQRTLAAGLAFYTRHSIQEVIQAAEDAVSAGEAHRG
jgi:hypothetical protein